MECKICNKDCRSEHSLGSHIWKTHKLLRIEYDRKFDLIKKCLICDIELSKNNEGGYCHKHRDVKGINNPFFGKKHNKKTIDIIKKATSKNSKELWKNKEYRDKVVNNATGLKRTDDFKETQRQNALEQFKDKEQREIRSKSMKASWKDEKIIPNIHSINESKQEIELRELVNDRLKGTDNVIKKKTIKINGRWYYPDIIINNNYLIEYNGNFWHGNPKTYKATDIVHHGFTAKEIWDRDKKRLKDFNLAGYKSLVIWEDEFKSNKEETVNKILTWLKGENENDS